MKTQTTYRIEPGDTIYLVTRDREIKAITLTEDHLGLVNEFEHDYTNKPCYYSDRGILHKDVIKRETSFSYQPRITETNIWLLTDKVNSQETEIPLYAIRKENDNAPQSKKLDTKFYPVFAYTTRELAQEQIRNLVKLDVANDIVKYIDFIVINDADNVPMKVYTYRDIDDWDAYIKKMADYNELPALIKLRKGQTFTKENFEAYVNKKFEDKFYDVKI